MIVIDKAVLHILDFNSGVTVYSDAELDMQDSIREFLLKHIEKSLASQEAKPGTFYEDSSFKASLEGYVREDMDFIAFSKEIVHTLEEAYTHSEEMASSDIILCDLRVDEVRKIALFKCSSHTGYVHQVNQTETGVRNEIIHHYSILPNLSQKMDEFAFVDVESQAVSFVGKRYTIDGNSIYVFPEILLECSQAPSPKEAMKGIAKAAAKVAEAYGQDEVATAAAVKSYIAENMEHSESLDLQEAGRQIFRDNPSMQADYEAQIQEAGFTEPVLMDKEATLKKVCRHKLKTDTGIELTIPTDYFDNTEYVEFNNNEDGTLSITLKHISNIVNRA
ncbi:MAG: nucleoid-associated protein [Selenomonadaceae bacterium]|nr:nucleoid-associated protein [Selenomonadaceae bacterium]